MLLLFALAVQQPGDSLSLRAALADARAHRSLGVMAAADVVAAQGALRSAGAIPNPTVTYNRSESTPLNHLTVEQPLDWLITRAPDRAAAASGVLRARTDSMQLAAQLDHDVRYAYWGDRAARDAARLTSAEEAGADSLAAIARARYQAGEISLLEQEQAALEAIRARQASSRAQEDVRTAAVALLRVVGRSVGFIIPVDSLDSGLDAIPPDDITSGGLPAVRAAVADSVARAAELTMARRLRVPMPALQVGAEWGDPSQPGALSVIGLAVPLPIWNQNGGAVMEARAQADRAAAQVEETRLDAWQQIASTRAHLEETVRRARLARDSLVPLAARLRDRALRGYAVGETDIRAALDALRSERQVRLEALQDQLAFQQALADWFLLAGGTQ